MLFRSAKNAGSTHLVLKDLETQKERQLTSVGSNWNGRWFPDGQRVAFLSTRAGAPQIHTIAVDGGEAQKVTEHPGGVANLAIAPTGTHFSFTADVALDPQVKDLFADLPHADAKIYDDLMVRHWDAWKDGTYSHLFVVPTDGGDARDLMHEMRVDTPLKPFGGGEQIAWSPDGTEICFVAKIDRDPEASTNSSRGPGSTPSRSRTVPATTPAAPGIGRPMKKRRQQSMAPSASRLSAAPTWASRRCSGACAGP